MFANKELTCSICSFNSIAIWVDDLTGDLTGDLFPPPPFFPFPGGFFPGDLFPSGFCLLVCCATDDAVPNEGVEGDCFCCSRGDNFCSSGSFAFIKNFNIDNKYI